MHAADTHAPAILPLAILLTSSERLFMVFRLRSSSSIVELARSTVSRTMPDSITACIISTTNSTRRAEDKTLPSTSSDDILDFHHRESYRPCRVMRPNSQQSKNICLKKCTVEVEAFHHPDLRQQGCVAILRYFMNNFEKFMQSVSPGLL